MSWSIPLLFAADAALNPVWGYLLTGGMSAGGAVLLNALLAAYKTRSDVRRAERADTITEWQTLVSKQDSQLAAQTKRIEDLDARIFAATQANIECERHHAETREKLARQEGIVEKLTQDVRRLEILAQVAPPPNTAPCILTVSLDDGVVRAASPASGPLLGWLPQELIGKSVEVLVPYEQLKTFRDAVASVRAGKMSVPTRSLHVWATKHAGDTAPVQVQLAQWTTPKGSVMVNADIRPEVTPQRGMSGPIVMPDLTQADEPTPGAATP